MERWPSPRPPPTSLENDTLAATLRLVVERWLSADGSLTLGLGDDATLQAEVSAAASALDWIEQFLPDLAGSRGAASLSLQATGTLTAPRLAFDLALDEGSLLVQPSGMRLTTLRLAGRMVDTHELRFDGSLGNADGSATVGGALTLDAAAGWPGHVTVRGERLAAVRLPEAEADLAPDLRIGFGPAGIDLSGSVGLPRVKVDIKQLPESAVAVSPDEVLIGPEQAAADAEPGSDFFIDAVTGQVDVTLGDDVWITAAGLRARLTGGLRWTKARGQSVGAAGARSASPKALQSLWAESRHRARPPDVRRRHRQPGVGRARGATGYRHRRRRHGHGRRASTEIRSLLRAGVARQRYPGLYHHRARARQRLEW